ncbi:MAG TPA: SIMPL domain-containing protein [Verrucomicrobiae bacterium]|nr:SIMPL domain-containing protein [Verrucomicrobiae bacterium]
MKTKSIIILLLASLTTALAQSQQPPPQINVSGSAEIKVMPDEIRLRVAVESRNAALNEARLDNDTKIAAALAFLKQAGLTDRDVKTDFISVQPDYDRNASRVTPVAYIIRKSIEIRLTNTVVFQSVVTGLLTNGVNVIDNVDFRTTQLRTHRDEARLLAVRAAKEKAKALTNELGVKLGRPYNVNATDNSYYPAMSSRYFNGSFGANSLVQNVSVSGGGGAADNASDAFAVGQISVTSTVNVSFLIE